MIFTGMRNPTRVTPFSSWLMEGVPPLDGGSRHIYVTWIEQSDLPQINILHFTYIPALIQINAPGSGRLSNQEPLRIQDDLYRHSLHHAFRLTPHSQLNFATL